MKIAFASDHRGFKLKHKLIEYLKSKGYSITDCGTYSSDACDYPDYVYPAARAVRDKKVERAIVICYSGVGSSIVANKVIGVRAALVNTIKTAKLSRKHNNSNVLVIGAGFVTFEYAKKMVLHWLRTECEGGRHLRRLAKINTIEEKEHV